MAKRFIDTNIFRKSFMKGISVEAKLFYVYLFCECDHCGIWQVEFEVAKVRLGLINLNEQDVLDYFADKIFVFDNGNKWFLPQFVNFQYGDLKANNKIHKSVINNLNKFGLSETLENFDDTKPFLNPLQRVKDKDKDMDKVKVKEMVMDKDIGQNSVKPYTSIISDADGYSNVMTSDKPLTPLKTAKNSQNIHLFKEFMVDYHKFITDKGLPLNVTQADGKALKSIIKYIESIDTIKAGERPAIDVWRYILNNWGKLSTWLQTQIQLRQINSQLPNIIQSLRTNGKQTNNSTSAQQLAEALRGVIQNGNSL